MAEQHDPLLERRLARNELAVAFARQLIAALGRERAMPLLARAVIRMRTAEARRLAEQWGDNSLTALGKHFCRLAAEQGILEVLECTEDRLAVHIHRCPSTEAFRQLGLPELAPLFCASEPAFIKAFNPRLKHVGRQTIARGAQYCDHVWVSTAPAEGQPAQPAVHQQDQGGAPLDARLQDRLNRYEMAVAFARQMIEELGEARAFEILASAFERVQTLNAQKLAQQLGSNSLEAFAEHQRKMTATMDNVEVLEVAGDHISMKITRCFAYEAMRELGLPQLCKIYCASDDAYIKAFNPRMKLVRTKTIAAGDPYCDHIWALETYAGG